MMELNSGSHYIPKSNSKNPQGEDAHFISDNTVGVADGVGGWASQGIDSGEYSRQLMSNSLISIMEQVHFIADPMRVLRDAFINTNAQGSSTACILKLTNDKSPTQQHAFNYPYQLGCGMYSDRPSSADILEFKEVMSGDVIVTGTDGLFDNLFTSEIEKIILGAEEEATSRGGKIDPKKVAQTLAEFALKKSLNPDNPTPFAEAQKENYSLSKGTGGKADDITVIVSYVS
ncbi:probable protein phosphatase 2C 55 [Papaver somniferum]|uniref:probable protein phosphatase 2C 55 n=1 Tax=Papaver somniferum TaxID=3469 RepID=UPI000E705DB5|nr:probable protein phosphatase 2C 55 [Papaver somniferum]